MIRHLTAAILCLPLTASAQPALTPAELHCAAFGVLAHAITSDRNTGIPLTTTLETVRTGILPWLPIPQAAADALALAIYADLGHVVTPDEARQAAEVVCLQPDTPATPMQPSRRGRRS